MPTSLRWATTGLVFACASLGCMVMGVRAEQKEREQDEIWLQTVESGESESSSSPSSPPHSPSSPKNTD